MTSDKDSLEVHRLEIVNTGRRRRWSREQKLRIVEESYQGHRQVSATARRHDIPRSLLYIWRKALGGVRHGDDDEPLPWQGLGRQVGFASAVVVPDRGAPLERSSVGRMEILTVTGRRIIVGSDVDARVLARVVAALERK